MSAVVSAPPPWLTDEEIDELCGDLTQNAAKRRFLEREYKVPVREKRGGRPLVMRADMEAIAAVRARDESAQNAIRGPNVVGLRQWSKGRKGGA